MFSTDDTIVAIATPAGRGGIGVVRISGPAAADVAAAVLRYRKPLRPRYATLCRVVATADRDVRAIDRVVATYFPHPASYTGEDVVEISAHGSPVLLRQIVRASIDEGARLAEPGEFTFRAYLNGRLDLVQAEAVADLVDAVTPIQARTAFDQLEGTLTNAIGRIHEALFDVSARLEASLDFPDEGYHFVEPGEAAAALAAVARQIDDLLAGAKRGQLIREGYTVVILGRTNSGKSSVFNMLSWSNRAIITAVPGTTRDLITETVDIGGIPITLVDTAGIRPAADEVEAEAIGRTHRALEVAEVVLLVLDRARALNDEDRALLDRTGDRKRVIAINKCDLPSAWAADVESVIEGVALSALTGAGINELRGALSRALCSEEPLRDTPAITNVRHIALLMRAKNDVERAAAAAAEQRSEEYVLADLQAARGALEEITGRRTPEDVLRHIFERFCVGK